MLFIIKNRYGMLNCRRKSLSFIFFLLLILSMINCQRRDSASKKDPSGAGILGDLSEAIDGGDVIPWHLRTAYVFNVRNRTYKAGVAQELTRKIKKEIERRGRLLIVDEKKKAHIFIYVDLEFFKRLPVTWDTIGRPTSVDLIAITKVKVRKRISKGKDDSSLIDPTKVEARVHYNVRGEGLVADYEAINRLTDSLGARIALTVETGWYTELKTERELGQKKDSEAIIGRYEDESAQEKIGTVNKSEDEEISELEEQSLGGPKEKKELPNDLIEDK
jgi:hypothetical protein